MLRRYAKLVLIGLMLVLPMQSTAAALAQILCSPGDHHSSQTNSHAQHAQGDSHEQHAQGAPHEHSSDEGSSGHEHSAGSCCHHIVTGIPLSFIPAGTADLPVYQSSLIQLPSLFVPEQPQRPPRA